MGGGRTHGGPTRLRVTVAWQATVSELHEQLRVEQTARLRAEENAAAIMVQQEQRNEARPSPCTLTSHHHPPPPPHTNPDLHPPPRPRPHPLPSSLPSPSTSPSPSHLPSWPSQLLEARLRELESKLQNK